jgi:hypothetical protein
MQYFDASEANDSFPQTAAKLLAEIDGAEPRLRAFDESQASASRAAGKWSRKQVLGHLIDSAANNHQRFVRGQEVDALVLPGYAQEHWVASQRYDSRPWSEIVGLWVAYNRHLAHVLANIPADKAEVPCSIGTYAQVTLGHIARDYVGHIRHHLRQIFEDA